MATAVLPISNRIWSPLQGAPMTSPWMPIAEKYLGFHEVGNNQGIEHFIALAHTGELGDAWCAIFVNACLEEAGVPGTRSARARSFEDSPNFVKLDKPVAGCIFTRWRVSPADGRGHTGFFLSENSEGIEAIAGNEDDAVRHYTEDKSKIVGYFWPKSYDVDGNAASVIPSAALFFARGRMSIFGGPDDTGSGNPAEGLALFSNELAPGIVDYLLPDTSGMGLFRRLNPRKLY